MLQTKNKLHTLSLKYLSPRLPYGVMCSINGDDEKPMLLKSIDADGDVILGLYDGVTMHKAPLSEVKPFLRSMHTMTADEREQLREVYDKVQDFIINAAVNGGFTTAFTEIIDFFNSHYIDYQGLIGSGQALEAPEKMYETSR